MKKGDLVRFIDIPKDPHGRVSGIVLRTEMYENQSGNEFIYTLASSSNTPIVEVLWSSGPGWIAQNRVEVISETR